MDGLRAVSIIGVLLFHVGIPWIPGGFVGVDVFFVISGFLITGIVVREIERGTFSYAAFYERRIRRIYPSLLLVLAASLAVGWVVMTPYEFRLFGRTLVWTPLFASNFAFMGSTGYFDPDSSVKPLLHTWSLGVEEQFYIVLPIVLAVCARTRAARTALVVALVVASFLAGVASGLVGYADAYFLLPMRFWELGCGALLALAPRGGASPLLRGMVGVVGLTAIVASMLFIDSGMAFPGWVAAFPVLGATALIWSGAGPAARLLSTAPMVFVGRISYAAYLWHWPMIVFAQMYVFHPLEPVEGVVVVAVALVVSWLTTAFVEAPVRTGRVLTTRRRLAVAAIAGSLALVAGGLAVFNMRHLDRWTSPQQRAIASFAHERLEIDELCPTFDVEGSATPGRCVLGVRGADERAPTFAVLGDSHSRALVGALSHEAERLGMTGLYLGRTGCFLLRGFDRVADRELRCAERLEGALRTIATADIPTVILISRWAVPVTGHDYGRSAAEVVPLIVDGRRVAEGARRVTVARSLASLLDVLEGRRVVLVDSVPEVRFDVPTVIANALRLGRLPPNGPMRAEFDARQRETRTLLSEVIAGRPTVERLEPADILCDAERCPVIDGDVPRYIDQDHLSRHGASLLAPLFDEALRGRVR